MMNPFSWLQMTNMISYQGLVRTFPKLSYKKGDHLVAFLFFIAFQSVISPSRSLGAIAFGSRLAPLSGRFGTRLGGASAGRGLALVGGFTGRFTLTCALRGRLAVGSCPFAELGAYWLAIARNRSPGGC